jgi:hypothetical protein
MQLPQGLNLAQNWQTLVITNLSLEAPITRNRAIAPYSVAVSSAIVSVQVFYPAAQPHWKYGGSAAMVVADGEMGAVVQTRSLVLQTPNLLLFPKTESDWRLQISFPRWLPQVKLVIKQFIGPDERETEQLDRIERKIDAFGFGG